VCAHRQSLLEPPGCGHREQLRCQYHGWCYDSAGRVTQVPDEESFGGLNTSGLKLKKLQLETRGTLVFVRLTPGPALSEQLGALGPELAQFYERPLRHISTTETTFEVNWKVIIDNAVESYHVPLVHPVTFGHYRPPEFHDHLLAPTFTRYLDTEPANTNARGVVMNALKRVLFTQTSGQRTAHAHLFPNTWFTYTDLFCDAVVVTPVSPTRSRLMATTWVPSNLRTFAFEPVLRAWSLALKRLNARVGREDASVWSAVQAGLESSPRSHAILSAREERVAVWHAWLKAQLTQRQSTQVLPQDKPTPKPTSTERQGLGTAPDSN
jgi:choline monooxygenase